MITTSRKTSPESIIIAVLAGAVLIGGFVLFHLNRRVRVLEDYLHFRDRWSKVHVTQRIVSEDKRLPSDNKYGTYYVTSSNQVQRFQITDLKAAGKTVAAWIGEYQPRSEMMKFDEFYVVPDSEKGFGELVVKPKAGETINMTFTIHLLLESYDTK
jgi:hypothetical protein